MGEYRAALTMPCSAHVVRQWLLDDANALPSISGKLAEFDERMRMTEDPGSLFDGDSKYACGSGGAVLSSCRRIGKTFTGGTAMFILCAGTLVI